MWQSNAQNPWEIDFIDKMFIFSEINDSSKFNPRSFNSTFQLASFSIHTSVKIYSERIDALYNFTMGFLTGLKTEKEGNKTIPSKEKFLFGEKKKKEKSKPFLLTWKFLNSKKNFLSFVKSIKIISLNERTPQKNFLVGFQLKKCFLPGSTKYSKITFTQKRLTRIQNFNDIFNFSVLININDLRLNFQIQNPRTFLCRESQKSSFLFKKITDSLITQYEKSPTNRKHRDLFPSENFTEVRKFQTGESLEKKIETFPRHFCSGGGDVLKTSEKKIKKSGLSKNIGPLFFLKNKKEDKTEIKKHFIKSHSVDKTLKTGGILNWVLQKKIEKGPTHYNPRKILQRNNLAPIQISHILKSPEKNITPGNHSYYWENQNHPKLLKSEKNKGIKDLKKLKFKSIFFNSFQIYPKKFFEGLGLKKKLKRCFFRLENFKETEQLLINGLNHRGINVTKFLLFFLQVASENKIPYISEINLNKIFFLTHTWVYSSNGRVSA